MTAEQLKNAAPRSRSWRRLKRIIAKRSESSIGFDHPGAPRARKTASKETPRAVTRQGGAVPASRAPALDGRVGPPLLLRRSTGRSRQIQPRGGGDPAGPAPATRRAARAIARRTGIVAKKIELQGEVLKQEGRLLIGRGATPSPVIPVNADRAALPWASVEEGIGEDGQSGRGRSGPRPGP